MLLNFKWIFSQSMCTLSSSASIEPDEQNKYGLIALLLDSRNNQGSTFNYSKQFPTNESTDFQFRFS